MNFLLKICFLSLPGVILGCDYIQFGSDHTMCKYQANACQYGFLGRGVGQNDINSVISIHNSLRNKVASGNEPGQPSATNMLEMNWDSELSTIAQRWTDQCTFGHDSNRKTSTYSWVGQNVAITSSTASGCTANFTQAVVMWYNEVVNPGFSSSDIDPFKFNSGAGHYTQVVWAISGRIGCGFACYKKDNWYNKLYVCNYGPGGNVIGTSMYKKGPAASACVNGKSTTYPALCKS